MKTKWLAIGIILLFVGTSIIPAIAQDTEKSSLSTSSGNWLYVGGSGPGNYTRIQDAIDNASDGDSIFIYNGEYEAFIAKKTLNIIGENRNNTVIISNPQIKRIRLIADWIHLTNLKIFGPYTSMDPALQTEGNNITVSNCNIVGGTYGNYGLEIGGSYSQGNYMRSDIKIINCDIWNFSYAGIIIGSTYRCFIDNCRIYNNGQHGIEKRIGNKGHEGHFYIYNCEIFNNSYGIELNQRQTFICNCRIYDNGCGILDYQIDSWTGDQITSCYIKNNFYGCLFDPYGGYTTKYSKVLGNIFENNDIDLYFTSYCFYNDIYHNNFFTCVDYHAGDMGNNNWDNGHEGNYWDDYTGNDTNDDGIGDTPYNVQVGNGVDSFPFMNPVSMNNIEPDVPTLTGPTECYQWVEYDYFAYTNDSNYDCVLYKFDWGDGTFSGWVGPFGNWEAGRKSHLWNNHGTFNVRVKAKDVKGAESNWSDILQVNVISNDYPTKPEVTGPSEGIAGHWITFSVKSKDIDIDQIRYVFNGSEEYTIWTDYNDSGEIVNINYRWGETWYKIEDKRIFTFKIRGQDIHGAYGPWYIQDITIFNNPPEKPNTYGPTVGITIGSHEKELLLQFTGWDIDNHRLKFYYKLINTAPYNNGIMLECWTGWYDCNETCNFSYGFNTASIFGYGKYTIMVQCIDHYGAVGPWSYHNITIKRLYRWFLDWIFERFPHAFPILRHLLEWESMKL